MKTLKAEWYKGCIEQPRVARGHAMFVDGKMQSATKINYIEFKFYWKKHVTHAPYVVTYCHVVLRNGWHPVWSKVPRLVKVFRLVDCTEEIAFLCLDGFSIPNQ